jgi:hypothetical protein
MGIYYIGYLGNIGSEGPVFRPLSAERAAPLDATQRIPENARLFSPAVPR